MKKLLRGILSMAALKAFEAEQIGRGDNDANERS
jgi:hypothetical protein